MWSAAQKRDVAKDIFELDFERGRALKYLTTRVREAIIAAHCFGVCRGQAAETVRVDAMDDLIDGVRAELCKKHPGILDEEAAL